MELRKVDERTPHRAQRKFNQQNSPIHPFTSHCIGLISIQPAFSQRAHCLSDIRVFRATVPLVLSSKSSSTSSDMSDKREATLAAIQAQGDLVRQLKAAKEAPEKVYNHSRSTAHAHHVRTTSHSTGLLRLKYTFFFVIRVLHYCSIKDGSRGVSAIVYCNVNNACSELGVHNNTCRQCARALSLSLVQSAIVLTLLGLCLVQSVQL